MFLAVGLSLFHSPNAFAASTPVSPYLPSIRLLALLPSRIAVSLFCVYLRGVHTPHLSWAILLNPPLTFKYKVKYKYAWT